MTTTTVAQPNQREPELLGHTLAVHIMSNTALTGATYDIDDGQQLVVARTAE